MSEPTIRDFLQLSPTALAGYEFGRAELFYQQSPFNARAEKGRNDAEAHLRRMILAEVDPTTIVPRARDIAARVAELDALSLAHPGMHSGVEERERIVGEIRRLMGAKC